jgi:hypothetical protein
VDRRARLALLRLGDHLDVRERVAALELLAVELAVAADLRHEPLRQRVDDGEADAVQATGDLVAVAAELAAGVQLRQHDRHGGEPLVLDQVDGDAAAAVGDRDGVVRMKRHLDAVVVSGERLVDGVVDDLVDEMVEAPGAGRADVHPRP